MRELLGEAAKKNVTTQMLPTFSVGQPDESDPAKSIKFVTIISLL